VAAPAAIVRREATAVDRLVAGLLLLMMAVGSLALWIVIPAGVLIALSKVVDSVTLHLGMGLILVPVAMVAFGSLLLWMNRAYLRVTGVLEPREEEDEDPRRLRGPLEPLLLGSFGLAILALFYFLIFIGGDIPQHQVL
jgi:hypothetical protein